MVANEISRRESLDFKKYIKAQFKFRDERFTEYKAVTKENVQTAFNGMEKRLAKLNELRDDVTEDRGIYITKDANEQRALLVDTRLGNLEKWQSKIIGIGIVLVLISGLIGAAIARVFFK